MNFTHIVGKSTFKYGFTIPKSIHPLISLPKKGEKRKIRLLINDEIKTDAWLIRLNNQYNHLQIRYDNTNDEYFRNWLKSVFHFSLNKQNNINEYFKVKIVNQKLFKIIPYPIIQKESKLKFSDVITHNIEKNQLITENRFIEILESIRNISFIKNQRQMYYNTIIKNKLIKYGWVNEQRVVEDRKIKLKCDFRKDDFQLEVEFGNARTYYQDIIKFVMSYNIGLIKIGGLLVPSKSFAKHLCHLGHLNALAKSKGSKSKYSGMMTFEKAVNEFQYIKNIFNIPFFIIGIDGSTQ